MIELHRHYSHAQGSGKVPVADAELYSQGFELGGITQDSTKEALARTWFRGCAWLEVSCWSASVRSTSIAFRILSTIPREHPSQTLRCGWWSSASARLGPGRAVVVSSTSCLSLTRSHWTLCLVKAWRRVTGKPFPDLHNPCTRRFYPFLTQLHQVFFRKAIVIESHRVGASTTESDVGLPKASYFFELRILCCSRIDMAAARSSSLLTACWMLSMTLFTTLI